MSRRRSYDREFKVEAVELASRGDKSMAQVARNLGISPNVLSNWKFQLKNLRQSPCHQRTARKRVFLFGEPGSSPDESWRDRS